MDVDKKRFEKMFPKLASEIEEPEENKSLDLLFQIDEDTGKKTAKKFEGYEPDINDFLRRCDTEQQAKEIIEFLERRGEISFEHACELKKQLKEKGVRSFGSKKDESHYLRESGFSPVP